MIERMNQLFERGIAAIEAKQTLFAHVESDPEIILTKLFDQALYQPFYGTAFGLVHHSRELLGKENEVRYHDLQAYLMGLVKPFLEERHEGIVVDISSPISYPSSMIIRYGDHELAHVSFYSHTFRDGREFYESLFETRQKSNAKHRDYLATMEKKFRAFVDSPWSQVHGFSDLYVYLFRRQKMMKMLRQRLASIDEMKIEARADAERLEKEQREYLAIKPELDAKLDELKQRFVDQYGYEFETDWTPRAVEKLDDPNDPRRGID